MPKWKSSKTINTNDPDNSDRWRISYCLVECCDNNKQALGKQVWKHLYESLCRRKRKTNFLGHLNTGSRTLFFVPLNNTLILHDKITISDKFGIPLQILTLFSEVILGEKICMMLTTFSSGM